MSVCRITCLGWICSDGVDGIGGRNPLLLIRRRNKVQRWRTENSHGFLTVHRPEVVAFAEKTEKSRQLLLTGSQVVVSFRWALGSGQGPDANSAAGFPG